MNYQPTNWRTGDVITQEKLNKLEHRVFVVECDANGVLNKTWQEIYNARNAGNLCIIQKEYTYGDFMQCLTGIICSIQIVGPNPNFFEVFVIEIFDDEIRKKTYRANSSNEYPCLVSEE